MNKQVNLSFQEQAILKKLNNDQLRFLIRIKDDKDFESFVSLVNYFIDMEKNLFFGEDESKYSETIWQVKHAYARGGVAKLTMLLRLIVGAQQELLKRSEKGKNK